MHVAFSTDFRIHFFWGCVSLFRCESEDTPWFKIVIGFCREIGHLLEGRECLINTLMCFQEIHLTYLFWRVRNGLMCVGRRTTEFQKLVHFPAPLHPPPLAQPLNNIKLQSLNKEIAHTE